MRKMAGHGKGTLGAELFTGVRDRVAEELLLSGDYLEVRRMQDWISFRSASVKRVFAELRPHRRSLEVFILPPPERVRLNGLARAAPPTQGWGWFQSKFRVVRAEDIGDAVELLMQSHSYRKEMSAGQAGRSRKER